MGHGGGSPPRTIKELVDTTGDVACRCISELRVNKFIVSSLCRLILLFPVIGFILHLHHGDWFTPLHVGIKDQSSPCITLLTCYCFVLVLACVSVLASFRFVH